jgi:hypothetical protein
MFIALYRLAHMTQQLPLALPSSKPLKGHGLPMQKMPGHPLHKSIKNTILDRGLQIWQFPPLFLRPQKTLKLISRSWITNTVHASPAFSPFTIKDPAVPGFHTTSVTSVLPAAGSLHRLRMLMILCLCFDQKLHCQDLSARCRTVF